MVKGLEQRQRDITSQIEEHSDGDKAFVIGASYILEVCSRAVELFDAETTTLEQKRYLIDFTLSNLTLEGKTLHFNLLEPFDAIAECAKSRNWYPILDRFRTRYYEVIVGFANQLEMAQQYLNKTFIPLGK